MEGAIKQNLMIAEAENIIYAQSLLSSIEIGGKPVVVIPSLFNHEFVAVFARCKDFANAQNIGEQLIDKIGEKLKKNFYILEADLNNPAISRGRAR